MDGVTGNGHLRSPTRLVAAASDAVAYRRLRGFVEYVGDGRRLTAKGNLALADGRALVDLLETDDRFDPQIGDRVSRTKSTVELGAVDLMFRVALRARFVRRYKGRLVQTKKAMMVDDPVETLYEAWCGLLELGPISHRWGKDPYGFGWYADELDLVLLHLLWEIHDLGGAAITDIVEGVWRHLLWVYDLHDVSSVQHEVHRDSVGFSLRKAFDVIGEFGAVTVRDVVVTTTDYGTEQRSGGIVHLTQLGDAMLHRFSAEHEGV